MLLLALGLLLFQFFTKLVTSYLDLLEDLRLRIVSMFSQLFDVGLQRWHIILESLIQLLDVLLPFFALLHNGLHQLLRFIFYHLTYLSFLVFAQLVLILKMVFDFVGQVVQLLIPQGIQLHFSFLVFLYLFPDGFDVIFHQFEFPAENILSICHSIDNLINSLIHMMNGPGLIVLL